MGSAWAVARQRQGGAMTGDKWIERLVKVNIERWVRQQSRGTAAYGATLSVNELGASSCVVRLGQTDDPDASSVVLYLRDTLDDTQRKLRDLIDGYNSAHLRE